MTPGIRLNIPFKTYHDWDAYRSSDVKAMRLGPPAMVPWHRANPSKETDATRLGHAAHCAILEKDCFPDRYAHKPEGMSFATKDGKEWKAAVPDGAIILTHAEYENVGAIFHAFASKHAAYDALLNATACEASLLWESSGIMLKGRPDFFDDGYIYDLKTTRFANERQVAFRAYTEGWMHQGAHYRAGLEALDGRRRGFRIVAIGPQPPQSERVYLLEIKPDVLDLLALENARTVERIAACRASGIWPGTPAEWTLTDLPPSALTSVVDMAGAVEDV